MIEGCKVCVSWNSQSQAVASPIWSAAKSAARLPFDILLVGLSTFEKAELLRLKYAKLSNGRVPVGHISPEIDADRDAPVANGFRNLTSILSLEFIWQSTGWYLNWRL
jgi:hypothetical protein